MDLTMFINAALSAAGVCGVLGALLLTLYKHNLKQERAQRDAERRERAALAAKLETLEKEKFAALELELKNHIKDDRSQEILVKLESLTGAVQKLTDLTTRALERNAGQEAHLAAHDNFLKNIDRVLQDHIKHPLPRR